MKSRNRVSRVVTAMACVGALLIGPANATGSDIGDGLEGCNVGEICMHDLYSTDRWRKHFWWSSSDHSPYQWWDATSNHYEPGNISYDINAVRNRDKMCWVKISGYNGHFSIYEWFENDGINTLLSDTNTNESHRRC